MQKRTIDLVRQNLNSPSLCHKHTKNVTSQGRQVALWRVSAVWALKELALRQNKLPEEWHDNHSRMFWQFCVNTASSATALSETQQRVIWYATHTDEQRTHTYIKIWHSAL